MPVIPLLERPTTSPEPTSIEATPRKRVRPRPLPELALVLGMFLIYKVGRLVADDHLQRAFNNASRVWHFEHWMHIPSEAAFQHALLHSDFWIRMANCYYAWVHFPVSVALLLWLYIYRPAHYIPIRRLMGVVTAIALAVHMVFPLAPPRMVTAFHMIDTATTYGPSVYGPPSTDTLSNQYAAMPSLHVGWALIVAIGFIVAVRSRWRWLWILYPIVTFVVVVGTANHYWLDGIVGGGLVAAVAPLPGVLRKARSRRETSDVDPVPVPREAIDDPVPAMLLNVWV